ncbi:YiiG family protein [Comamonas sp. Y33R10-2]|uniref:DUF3829 domain-containing protein n=1 Tax=Comamonas sp. Y33R10-2 TaxID=2853257 RepID=UPI001C5C8AF5|nr:DUF3829 domain-containing protein [Comamonas sp. Y33R10-2]QXZ08724.1 YiiG family protein [Comamonas sp. Y33R10-2]
MRSWKKTALSMAIAGLGSMALVGCGDDKKPDANPSAASTAAATRAKPAADASQEQTKTRNAYTQAYNAMIDDNRAVAAYYRSYQKQNINGKGHNDHSFYGGPDDIERKIKPIKESRAAGSGDAQLDAAADNVVAAGEKLIAVWTPLVPYFKGKGFLEDNWAKAKENDPAMTAGFEGMLAAIDKLGTELDRVQDQKQQERLAKYKADGDLLMFNLSTAMSQAKKLVNGVDKTDSLQNKAEVAKVDAIVKELETTLEAFNKAIADEKAKSGKDPHYNYKLISDKLSTLVGSWRTLKSNPTQNGYRNLVGYYNDAVGYMGRGFER